MNLELITPLILTRDEEVNLGRTLQQLRWATEVVVVDSFSTDATEQVARSFPNVRFLQREFDTLAAQSNFGIGQSATPWVLLLDADYYVPEAFVLELAALEVAEGVHAAIAPFTYAVDGKPLRASLYPPRVVLLHKRHCMVWQDGHAHRVKVSGATVDLRTPIVHDDRKPFARFVARQNVYMKQEASKIRSSPWRSLPMSGRLRKFVFLAPPAALIHSLFTKRLILDGREGLRYAAERVIAELILSKEMLRQYLTGASKPETRQE